MIKVDLPHNSYAYLDFVSDEEKNELKAWIFKLHKNKELNFNPQDHVKHRFFISVSKLESKVPDVFYTVKQRLMQTEGLYENQFDPYLGDFLSVNFNGARIHKHTDKNLDNHIHTRYNLIISKPEIGGDPFFGGERVDYEERMIWRLQAGKFTHASRTTRGPKPRINISFGFQIAEDTI